MSRKPAPDLFRDSPHAEAERNRICAQVALIDPHWPPEERQRRHDYMGLAERAAQERQVSP